MGLIDLSGRGALVVGAGQGIGRATALLLGRAGARTVVLDRHRDRAEQVALEIREAGGFGRAVVADGTVTAQIRSAVAEAEQLSGGLDLLVNITGSATWAPLLALEDADWERDFAVNLDQHLQVSRMLAEHWIETRRPGVICVVASISGVFASPGHAAYGAAKAGLLGFVRTAAEEWWPSRIRVNAVVPGSVRTPRIEATLMEEGADRPADLLTRMAMPEDVAGPIAFLVSDLARRITGQTVVIDGGTGSRFPYALS